MGFLEEAYSHKREKRVYVVRARERFLHMRNFTFTGDMYSQLLQLLVRNEVSDQKQINLIEALERVYMKFYSGYEAGIAYEIPTKEETQIKIKEFNEKLMQDDHNPIEKVLSYNYSAISTEQRKFSRRSTWIFYGSPEVTLRFKNKQDKKVIQQLLQKNK